ncbi:MAG TPA: carboxymuconolactone decarboxylase family protein, partial [Paenirhodobacter sp.]
MTNIAAGVVLSTLGATGADAQENRRAAPSAVYDVAPGLGHFTDDVLFGEVWQREGLVPRDRSLVTVAALVATGRTAQIAGHAGRALDNGVTPEELGELITHLAFYTGWPNAMSAVTEVKQVFDARGIAPVTNSDAPRLPLDPAAEAARANTVNADIAPTTPGLAD